jgi:hypothetical protein
MQITSIFSGYSDPAKAGRRNEPLEAAIGAAAKADALGGSNSALSPGSSEAMREILGQYDVTGISPRAFSEMLQKLNRAGVLPDKDFQELSLIRLDLERDGIEPDDRVYLVQLYARKLRDFQEQLKEFQEKSSSLTAAEAAIAPLRRRLECLQKFAAIHANPGAVGLDALA